MLLNIFFFKNAKNEEKWSFLIPLAGENLTQGVINGSNAEAILFCETMQFLELDRLKNTHGSNWTYINFPFHISDKVEKLWIYKV